MQLDLRGRIAIITGASRRIGIGAAIARTFAAAGADIFLTYFMPYDADQPWGSDPREVEQQLAALKALGARAYGMEANLSQPETPRRIFEAVEGLLGKASILVNNATVSENGGIDTLDAAQLDRHYAVNVRSTTLLCKEFVRRWPGGPGGRIINMTSGQGVTPMPGELAYATTKGAVEALTTSLAARPRHYCQRRRPGRHRHRLDQRRAHDGVRCAISDGSRGSAAGCRQPHLFPGLDTGRMDHWPDLALAWRLLAVDAGC
jgi:3-oxoacyl-[acyl-carrier protein] reductase